MKSRRKKPSLFRRILNRYKKIPRQLHSRRVSERSKAQKLITITICVPVLIYCAGYMGWYKFNQSRIERENALYSSLYATQAPTMTPTTVPTATPTIKPTSTPLPVMIPHITANPASDSTPVPVPLTIVTATPLPTEEPTAYITVEPTPEPTPVLTMEPAPTPTAEFKWELEPTLTPMPTFEVVADATRSPYTTPDANTLVLALETPAPIQESFKGLLDLNPETVGYLTIGQDISLPVVQRRFDNDYYLSHNFVGGESNGGTLFLDGANLLTPEDVCLIVYGHNMKNGTMFHKLLEYDNYDYLSQNPLVYFDTIYKNRVYAPFAVFSASMDEGSKNYIDIRRFDLDEYSFSPFIERMRKLSLMDIPVDVQYGDDVLLLVTCEYTYDNGRFVLALRSLRDGESEEQLVSSVLAAKKK